MEIVTNDGHTALLWACERGHDQCLDKLIEKSVNINQQDKQGYTALIHAAHKGHLACVKKLMVISNFRYHRIKDNKGHDALEHAIARGHADCVAAIQPKTKESKGRKRAAQAEATGAVGVSICANCTVQ